MEKLDGEHDGWVVTPEIRQAILDIWPPNFWSSAAQVRERSLAAGHISSLEEISESSIHRVARKENTPRRKKYRDSRVLHKSSFTI